MWDDPNKVLIRDDNDEVNPFLKSPDAPLYKNTSDNEAKRKKNVAKEIATAFKNAQIGGDLEEDWERHLAEYQAVALDYQVRSKDLAYFLTLTLRDQALAVNRAEYPKNIRTYPKICEILRYRFDNKTKRGTNNKALMRLDFKTFLKEANGPTLKAF